MVEQIYIKNLELKHNNDLNYFNFFDKGSFSRIFDISEWKVVTKILKDIFISSEKNNLGHINSDFEPQDKDIKIKFNNSFLSITYLIYFHHRVF